MLKQLLGRRALEFIYLLIDLVCAPRRDGPSQSSYFLSSTDRLESLGFVPLVQCKSFPLLLLCTFQTAMNSFK